MKNGNTVLRSYVQGQWLKEDGRIDLEIKDPGDLSKISSCYQFASGDDVKAAAVAAKKAFPGWANTPVSERIKFVHDFIEVFRSKIEDIARVATKEMGKPIIESRSEGTRAVTEMTFWAGEGFRLGDRTFVSGRRNTEAYCIRQPIGPVAAITPWNFPILTPLRKVIPALICGCTVLLKPAIQAAGPSVLMTEIFDQIGLPKGVFGLIIGSGRAIGDALTACEEIVGISFTGSTEVGLHIGIEASKRNARVQLEMGGKNAAVVADYSDLDFAAKEIINAAFTTSGQRCTSVSRVIVLDKHLPTLEKHLKKYADSRKTGYGLDESTEMGPLASQDQFEKVFGYVEIAKKEKLRIVSGGQAISKNGYYFAPTIISDVPAGSVLATEEIFGPVLVVIPVKTFEEALAVNNETQYGLTSAIFTDNMDYAHAFTIRSETGMVHVNHGTSSEGHCPFGGWKYSGQGAFGIGDTSKDFFTILKMIYRMYRV